MRNESYEKGLYPVDRALSLFKETGVDQFQGSALRVAQ